MPELEQILADIQATANQRALRRKWQPAQCGDIDIRIAADGQWYHEGRRFERAAMVKLFAGILRWEDEAYFLVTPVEKLRIQVEDAPFVATLVEEVNDDAGHAIVFTTNIGERILLGPDNGLRIEVDADSATPRPYLLLPDGLEALISRSAFYDLLTMAEEKSTDQGNVLVVTSQGHEFELGKSDE